MKYLALITVILLLGCSSTSERSCQNQEDCFLGEVCVDAICRPDPEGPDTGDPSNQRDVSHPDGTQPDANQPDANQPDANQPDANQPDANHSDTNNPPLPPVTTTSCVEDAFTPCVDPTGELDASDIESGRANDAPDAGNPRFTFSNNYCSASPETGMGLWEWLKVDMLCPAEPADYYRFHIQPCLGTGLILEVDVILEPICHEDEVRVDARRLTEDGFEPIPCSAEAPCERDGDTWTRKFLIAPGTTAQSIYFGIVSEQDNTMFKYTVDARIRVP
ncbi:MAG: hypothetical protein ACNA8W_06550 [Bradymonadaceae bacterium]